MEIIFVLICVYVAICLLGNVLEYRQKEKVHKREVRKQITLSLSFNNLKIRGKQIMAITMLPNQNVAVEILPVDRKGNPAQIEEGSVIFASSDQNVFTIVQNAEDELKATITSVGPGVAELTYSLDADLDDTEVRTLEGFTAVEVTPEEAVGISLVAGPAQDL